MYVDRYVDDLCVQTSFAKAMRSKAKLSLTGEPEREPTGVNECQRIKRLNTNLSLFQLTTEPLVEVLPTILATFFSGDIQIWPTILIFQCQYEPQRQFGSMVKVLKLHVLCPSHTQNRSIAAQTPP